jgi:hypothetical protein
MQGLTVSSSADWNAIYFKNPAAFTGTLTNHRLYGT